MTIPYRLKDEIGSANTKLTKIAGAVPQVGSENQITARVAAIDPILISVGTNQIGDRVPRKIDAG